MLGYPDGLDERSAALEWADWLELSALFSAAPSISRSDIREILELRSLEGADLEAVIDDAIDHVASRESILGGAYPVEQVGVQIRRRKPREECLCFSFLLALSTRHFFGIRTDDEAARLFEYVTAAAIERYISGRSVRIGARREAPVPSSFRECLLYLASMLGEPSRDPMNPHAQDENVDIVGWLPFADGKSAQLIVLAQCKTQRDWDQALDSINLDVWNDQMAWGVTPVKAFAFPYVFDEARYRRRYIAKQGGIPFDRLRLSELARDEDLADGVQERIARWCDSYAARLPDPSELT